MQKFYKVTNQNNLQGFLLILAIASEIKGIRRMSDEMTATDLQLELAIALYQQQKISSGKIRSWLGLTVIEFQHELAKRGLCLNYDVKDLQADLKRRC